MLRSLPKNSIAPELPQSTLAPMRFVRNDGGRAAAGFKGTAKDCVTRAIAIATGIPYFEVYRDINILAQSERLGRKQKARSNSRTGVYTPTVRTYMEGIGWKWVPTMHVGAGCKVHLQAGELPPGRLVAKLSRHLVAVIDGVVHDLRDPSRGGKRCVYGYWTQG